MVAKNSALAEDLVDAADEVDRLAQILEEGAKREKQRNQELHQRLDELKIKLHESKGLNENLAKELKTIKEMAELEEANNVLIDKKYQKIEENFDKYVFKTRLQKWLPLLYAGAAISLANNDADEKLLFGLAGYGAGAALENTGYGLAGGITLLKYSIKL